MSIVRYRQWQAEPSISDGLRQMLDSLGRTAAAQGSQAWVPAVDIVEEPARFVLAVDLPGVDPAGIELLVEKNELVLRGLRASPVLDGQASLARGERRFGAFERRFVLPDSVDAEQVSAHGEHGVLSVVLPRKAQPGPRRISIGAAPVAATAVPADARLEGNGDVQADAPGQA